MTSDPDAPTPDIPPMVHGHPTGLGNGGSRFAYSSCDAFNAVVDDAIRAAGGWSLPFVDLTPWLRPDRPLLDHVDVEEWLFPRWTDWERTWSDLPRRCRVAWRVLRIGYSHHQEPH